MKVLAVVAHPDDEVLGAGATLAKHALAGDEVRVLILGTGVLSRQTAVDDDVTALRRAAVAASDVLGVAAFLTDLPDNQFDTVPLLEIVRIVQGTIEGQRPEIVYTHHAGDLNVDHRCTHEAVLVACRPQAGCTVRSIYAFEVPSATEWGLHLFAPTVFMDVSGEPMRLKLKALECYASEMRPFPHPRSMGAVTALARWRGATAGVEAAEAFEVVREVR